MGTGCYKREQSENKRKSLENSYLANGKLRRCEVLSSKRLCLTLALIDSGLAPPTGPAHSRDLLLSQSQAQALTPPNGRHYPSLPAPERSHLPSGPELASGRPHRPPWEGSDKSAGARVPANSSPTDASSEPLFPGAWSGPPRRPHRPHRCVGTTAPSVRPRSTATPPWSSTPLSSAWPWPSTSTMMTWP